MKLPPPQHSPKRAPTPSSRDLLLCLSALSTLSLSTLAGCQLDEAIEGNGGAQVGGAQVGGAQVGGAQPPVDLCAPPSQDLAYGGGEASQEDPSFGAPQPSCFDVPCEAGFVCQEIQECYARGGYEECECDPATGEIQCVVYAEAGCALYSRYECVPSDEPPPPPPSACEAPNPSLTCLTEGCPDGLLCAPLDVGCTPSSCECDETTGDWVCTRDCGPAFACVDPEAPPPPPTCPDADRDGACDTEDSACETDGVPLSCRRVAPECPMGTVPEVTLGCYTDRCVDWAACAASQQPVTPRACGGFRQGNEPCPEGTFCQYPAGTMCGAYDLPGVCVALNPDLNCTADYTPVCGCDGVTYSNECAATRAGTSASTLGECGAGGDPAGAEGDLCGSRGLAPCGAGLWCERPIEAQCGVADQPGVCVAAPQRPIACPDLYAPVCGCDGVTYSNDCEARAAMVSLASLGECASERVTCGGFAGLPCPGRMLCVDDPLDSCDPNAGGADCPGVCVTP